MKSVTLADVVGQGRDELVAAWCLCLLDNHLKKGTIEGPVVDLAPAWRIVERRMAAGEEAPTDKEVVVGLVFVRTAFPNFRLTDKGRAAAEYMTLFEDAGHG